MQILHRDQSALFFLAARLNAIFSILCGVTMAVGASTVAGWLGIERTVDVMVIGIILILFAGRLFMIVRSGQVPLSEGWSIVAGDLGWVIFSLVLLLAYPDQFSGQGLVLVAATATAVLAFGLGQALGLRGAKARDA